MNFRALLAKMRYVLILGACGAAAGLISGLLIDTIAIVLAGVLFGLAVLVPMGWIMGLSTRRITVAVFCCALSMPALLLIMAMFATVTLALDWLGGGGVFTLLLTMLFAGLWMACSMWAWTAGETGMPWSHAILPVLVASLSLPVVVGLIVVTSLILNLHGNADALLGIIFWFAITGGSMGLLVQPAEPDLRYCRGCGYDLYLCWSNRCPECGKAIAVEQRRELARLGEAHRTRDHT